MKLFTSFLICATIVFAQAPPPRAVVQANATASISVTPDQARINVSAVTRADTAQDAASQNATIAKNISTQVTQALGGAGSVKTVSYNVGPIYNNQGMITGYTVTNTMEITLNDLSIAGNIIDTATQAGASRVDSLQFTLKDDTDARTQALKAATVKAKANADAMAASAGLKTGPYVVITQSGAAVQPIFLNAGPAAGATTPIQPGPLTVTGTVSVELALMQ